MVIILQDAFLTALLLGYLILRPQVVDDFLLLAIHPADRDYEEELPRVQNKSHDRPDEAAKAPTMHLDLPLVNSAVGQEFI